MGVDFVMVHLDIDGQKVELQVWDTAGMERFRTLTASYFKGADAAAVVYEVDQRQSFELVNDVWREEMDKHTKGHLAVALIGNKTDLRQEGENHVTTAEGQAYAREHDYMFFEASAMRNEGCREPFEQLARRLMRQRSGLLEERREAGAASPATAGGIDAGSPRSFAAASQRSPSRTSTHAASGNEADLTQPHPMDEGGGPKKGCGC